MFPSLKIRTFLQRNQDDNIGDEDKKFAIENFHKHPLILIGDDEEVHDYKKLVCDIYKPLLFHLDFTKMR